MTDLDRRVLWYVAELWRGDRRLAEEWLSAEGYELRLRVARAMARLEAARR